MSTPPYRADHVGSLLRPASVKDARKKFYEDKSISAEELKAVEDEGIKDLIKLQESVGLKVVTDGEARRHFWHYDFMGLLDGLEFVTREAHKGVTFHGVKLPPTFPTINGKLDFPDDHPHLEHFKFLAANTKVTPKISIPGPSVAHYRTARADVTYPEYQDPEALFAALARTYAKAVQKFYEAGCRYLQMDDIYFAYLGDEKQRAMKREEGYDPDWLIQKYAETMHEAIKDRPKDMLIGMHMCRGNFRSTWAAEGGYDAAADAIFNKTGVDMFFMEYDTERSGGLQPLSLLPKGSKQRVYPGFITTKTGELETLDSLRRHFDEASKFVDIDQLGIAPQCGFASTEEGNSITEDDQKRKLELVVKTAEAIWGTA
ncbi:5-methyltetrahydropteroyltriglutamate--homocysteine S-methyltransferase [Neorhizobium vignae]|uniref:5-methyltetrahydropteroyltriglutamate-- homocysteine S-methyltransferase n=1 Tax=Neorhizobium vignae TaxID=690585 RepID=UPI00055AEBFE|nr:5-methyltetrahydropteroyltriglutamate--homocysteine S-methyltransferase [Neorhizobium vignae]